MTPLHSQPAAHHRGFVRVLLVLALIAVLFVGLLVAGVASYFRLSRDARCLRNSLIQAVESQAVGWRKKVEFNVGSFTCAAVREGLEWVHIDPKVRTALNAVRAAEVGVYRLDRAAQSLDYASLLDASDASMAERGWVRLVGVQKGRQLVAIYVPKQQPADRPLRTCLAITHAREMVIVSATSQVEALMELAMQQEPLLKSRRAAGPL